MSRNKGGRPRRTEPCTGISVSLPDTLIESIVADAEKRDENRSEWIENAAYLRLESEGAEPPERLFQDELKSEPFWMVVACILVNKTRWATARPILRWIRERWPTPKALAGPIKGGWEVQLAGVIEPLGMHMRRAKDIRHLARLWNPNASYTAEDIVFLPGCGRYVADSWAIFIEGRLDREPKDPQLLERWKALKGDR